MRHFLSGQKYDRQEAEMFTIFSPRERAKCSLFAAGRAGFPKTILAALPVNRYQTAWIPVKRSSR
jgi:hypothetical protein